MSKFDDNLLCQRSVIEIKYNNMSKFDDNVLRQRIII